MLGFAEGRIRGMAIWIGDHDCAVPWDYFDPSPRRLDGEVRIVVGQVAGHWLGEM